jgi:hypothetical protein
MKKEIRLNAFANELHAHQSAGLGIAKRRSSDGGRDPRRTLPSAWQLASASLAGDALCVAGTETAGLARLATATQSCLECLR